MNTIGVTFIWCALQVSVFVIGAGLLYLLVRRLSLAAGGLIAAASLAVVIVISGLAFSPWPRWERTAGEGIHSAQRDTTLIPETEEVAESLPVPAKNKQPANLPGTPNESFLDWMSGFGEALTQELSVPTEQESPTGWRWTEIAVVVCLFGCGAGFVRLTAGLWMVRAFRKRGRPIADAELLQLTDVLCAELSCRRPVELLEADLLSTPATVGWRRPVILMPVAWRSWTEQERRAVLAHEIAHIRSGDFLTYAIAQIGLTLHFYNPLVHWLTGRLRLEQELAADASAAALAGGRMEYLQLLAAMALRQADRPLSWAARTFLPSRGHLLRRVEMLKHSKRLPTRLSAVPRMLLVGILVAAGIGIVGLREPQQREAVADEIQVAQKAPQKRPAATKPRSDKFELAYVPSNAMLVVGFRPAAMLQQPELAALKETLKDLGLQKMLGMPLEEIEQITGVSLAPDRNAIPGGLVEFVPGGKAPQRRMAFGVTTIRAIRPTDFQAIIASTIPDAKEELYLGQKYYKSAKTGFCYFRPDDRTIVMDIERTLKQVIASGPAVEAEFLKVPAWKEAAKNHFFYAIDSATVDRDLGRTLRAPQQAAIMGTFAPLWEQTESLIVGVKLDADLTIQGVATCARGSDSESVEETLVDSVALLKNLLKEATFPDYDDKNLAKTGMALLEGSQVIRKGKIVRISSTTTVKFDQMLWQVMSVVVAQVGSARQNVSRNNLKQIALAMHNYHSAHDRFPSAVLMGPDKKTPHSWRVALLPHFNHTGFAELYKQYKLDEPWDSKHNKQLIEKMPAIYGHPARSANAAYFVFTGPGTPFGNKEGIRFADIIDGTSNTLMVVEARRKIPWTKPEDIPYDPAAPFPKLRSFELGQILAAKIDGAVVTIPAKGIPDELWRAVITHNGRETEQIEQSVEFFKKLQQKK